MLAPVPGVREFAHDLSSLEQTHRLRAALTALPAGKTVLVVGGGTTAIEMVTELAVARPGLGLKLITSSLLAPTVSPKARSYVRNARAMRRVDIIENTPITEVTRTGVLTVDGRTVAADCIVWAASFAVPQLANNSGLAVDRAGRLLVDSAMRSTVHPNILGAGDGARPRYSDRQLTSHFKEATDGWPHRRLLQKDQIELLTKRWPPTLNPINRTGVVRGRVGSENLFRCWMV